MRGDKDDVLGVLLGCNGAVTTQAVTEMTQHRAYAEDCLGFWNRLWGLAAKKDDAELPPFPPLRRVRRSLRALARAGYIGSVYKWSEVERRWGDHYAASEKGEEHYYRQYPHMRPAQA